MPFTIVRQDITKMKVDVIVNAANTSLKMGGGVCGAIFRAAGARRLQKACDSLAPIRTGEAVITPGFDLPVKYIIHTAGPVYSQWSREENVFLLRSAYTQSLILASEYGCESIVFPLISSGIYGYPKDQALQVAVEAVSDFLDEHDMEVYLAVFDRAAFLVSGQLMGEVTSYIDQHYVDAHEGEYSRIAEFAFTAGAAKLSDVDEQSESSVPMMQSPQPLAGQSLDDLIADMDEPFAATLFRLIDCKGKTDTEVYKKANIDRKLFSKIRSVKGYTPKKTTILALAISLELTLAETDDLLERAGYALSHASKFDVIVEYFIVNGRYNIFEINQVLFKYDQPLLGGA